MVRTLQGMRGENSKSEMVILDYTKGELKEKTERLDREIEESRRLARIKAEREAKEKRELEEVQNSKVLMEMNLLKVHLNKPVLSSFVSMNMKSGKTRNVRQGEFRPLTIDYSDPSPLDGDLILPERKGVTKRGKKK
jgi:hypothetical protein